MASPNIGKSSVDQALSIARALMVYSPTACDNAVAIAHETTRLMHEGRFTHDTWRRVICTDYERYIKYPKSGGGVSRQTLPEGESVIITIDVRGRQPVTKVFAQFVEAYERDSILERAFQSLAFGDSGDDTPVKLERDPTVAASLRKTLEACADRYNEQQIRQFRLWIKNNAKPLDVRGKPRYLVLPDHLREFSRHLAGLRAAHAADVTLFGSIATASQLCNDVALRAFPEEGPERYATFLRLASPLVESEEVHPVRIVNGVIQHAVDDGFVDALLNLADSYMQKVQAGILAAKSCVSIENFLDKLYDLVPRAFGAHLIYARLDATPSRLTEEQSSLIRGRLNQADETLVTLSSDAFVAQLTDFAGERWAFYRRRFKQAGKEAAEHAAKELEQLLTYPAPVVANLISEAFSPEESKV